MLAPVPVAALAMLWAVASFAKSPAFAIEEAGIADVQRAIQSGATTCRAVVEAYLDRARAYNGACTALVTADGLAVAPAHGAVRAGSPLDFPTRTVDIHAILPNLDQYQGIAIDYGRMEPTASDPAASQQYGMLAGIADAGQLGALNTLNVRGERSVTCKGAFDAAPSSGPLPADAPAVCERFRQQPDALETAAALDARYGRRPDLKALPMYCAVMSFKDVYDTTDMRSTGGADAAYAMDAAPRDATVVAELRAKGAIIYAKANLAEYNAGSGNPGGAAKATAREYGAGARSTWGGASCNPYDTRRETGGSSSGSAVSVGANLVMCSLCEETGGSCRQPAWRNDVVALVTTKGLVPYGGAIGADPYLDRAGIQCRTVTDAARVLDAIRDPQRGYFDPRDVYSALPRSLVPEKPYASFAVAEPRAGVPKSAGRKPLAGVRIGIVREFMVEHAANDRAMSRQVDAEIKRVLRDGLGATLVESRDPLYPDDPAVPDMEYDFRRAMAEILPLHMPEYLAKKNGNGERDAEGGGGGGAPRPDAEKLTFDVADVDITRRDYLVAASLGKAPVSDLLNLRTVSSSPGTYSFSLHLAERGDARIADWASLNANAKYYNAERIAAMKNWGDKLDIQSAGITQRVKMRDAMRMVIQKVMQQSRLDVLVNPTTTIPPALIGHASQPQVNNRPVGRFPLSADLGLPEITVPAGFNDVVYEPAFALNDRHDGYVTRANETAASTMPHPMPVGLSFWSGVGEEPAVIRIASIYEAATRHRRPPTAFGPVRSASH